FNNPNKENVIGTNGGKYGNGTNSFDLLAIIIPLPARIFLDVPIYETESLERFRPEGVNNKTRSIPQMDNKNNFNIK
ncbi:MAG: hypothetical protein KKD07_10220, partial [Candidatus Omnitrophica bacterium]|nr:hypothetical protein [Candidatus Omnitrophota bacterium]